MTSFARTLLKLPGAASYVAELLATFLLLTSFATCCQHSIDAPNDAMFIRPLPAALTVHRLYMHTGVQRHAVGRERSPGSQRERASCYHAFRMQAIVHSICFQSRLNWNGGMSPKEGQGREVAVQSWAAGTRQRERRAGSGVGIGTAGGGRTNGAGLGISGSLGLHDKSTGSTPAALGSCSLACGCMVSSGGRPFKGRGRKLWRVQRAGPRARGASGAGSSGICRDRCWQ